MAADNAPRADQMQALHGRAGLAVRRAMPAQIPAENQSASLKRTVVRKVRPGAEERAVRWNPGTHRPPTMA